MIPFDSQTAAWRDERARRLARYASRPRFEEEGLTLGPMTIVASLRPGISSMPLQVKTDGTVMDGNTRIRMLQGRGYDVESLPRQLYLTAPMGSGGSLFDRE